MKNSGNACFVCGSVDFTSADRNYRRCSGCGHETLINAGNAGPIINDTLSETEVMSFGLLDRFKRNVLRSCMVGDKALLDVGTASGKFLYHNKRYFQSAFGIEVTKECVDFARNRLGLVIFEDIAAVKDAVSIASFWHSLEHIPAHAIDRLFSEIERIAAPDIRIIISVPNAGSLQRHFLGERYAYYDSASHIHQFTARSLDRLLQNHGYVRERSFFSVAYAAFGSLQGLINLFMNDHNYLYYRKKRSWDYGRKQVQLALLDGFNYLFATMLFLPATMLTLLESYLKKRGAVLTVCYRKKILSKS